VQDGDKKIISAWVGSSKNKIKNIGSSVCYGKYGVYDNINDEEDIS